MEFESGQGYIWSVIPVVSYRCDRAGSRRRAFVCCILDSDAWLSRYYGVVFEIEVAAADAVAGGR